MSVVETITFDPQMEKQVMISYMEYNHEAYCEAKYNRDRAAGMDSRLNARFQKQADLMDAFLDGYIDLILIDGGNDADLS